MDRAPYGAAALGEITPGITLRPEVKESGKWQQKMLGKSGKMVMVICLE